MPKLRLLLADDHTLVRHGLRKMLEEQQGWEVAEEVGDGRAAIEAAAVLKPDVAVIDAAMPLLNGIDATPQIVQRAPQTRVLILSMHADEAYLARALQAGAAGYILKDSAATDLVRGVETVAAGRPFFSPNIERLMLEDYMRRVAGNGVADKFATLSRREREIFQLIAEGRTSRSVATLLDISAATVETHRARIMHKLDLHNATELVLYAVRKGVIS
jgi:DNA-binding NarL/FixJ family response regulator